MIQNHINDDPDTLLMGCLHHLLKIFHCSVIRIHTAIIGNIVSVIYLWRGIKRSEPDSAHSQFFQIRQLRGDPPDTALPVLTGVTEGSYIYFVKNRIFPPLIHLYELPH